MLLPRELLTLIETGRWRCPSDPSGLDRLFPERAGFFCYSFGAMEGETQVLYRYSNPMWRGIPDPTNQPGDIDPTLAVLIADLGIGYDQPIALDYRPSMQNPRVLTLRWDKPNPPVPWEEIEPWRDGKRQFDEETTSLLRSWYETTRLGRWNRWVELSPNFKTFAEQIRL